jgi:DNA polymerase
MLYADTAVQKAARWLVLLEAPSSALESSFDPLADDAGKLLDNMLRAAKLHMAGAVLLAPLVRSGTGGDLPSALASLLASAQAHVVLVMGRLAAQALLQSTEPLAKLRGQIHAIQGQQTVITIDPAYLLRNPLEKAKAWDDICLALSVAEPVSAP